jgi:ribonuclease P protein component
VARRPPRRAELGFPAAARVRRRSEFEELYARGSKLVESRLVAFIGPAADGRSRLGLSVSRKVGGAPRRNRVKRVLREAFRPLAPAWPEPIELVLVARPGTAPGSLAEAREPRPRTNAGRAGGGLRASDRAPSDGVEPAPAGPARCGADA